MNITTATDGKSTGSGIGCGSCTRSRMPCLCLLLLVHNLCKLCCLVGDGRSVLLESESRPPLLDFLTDKAGGISAPTDEATAWLASLPAPPKTATTDKLPMALTGDQCAVLEKLERNAAKAAEADAEKQARMDKKAAARQVKNAAARDQVLAAAPLPPDAHAARAVRVCHVCPQREQAKSDRAKAAAEAAARKQVVPRLSAPDAPRAAGVVRRCGVRAPQSEKAKQEREKATLAAEAAAREQVAEPYPHRSDAHAGRGWGDGCWVCEHGSVTEECCGGCWGGWGVIVGGGVGDGGTCP